MRIILFGGAFNPVHAEHIRMAEEAVRALRADKLIVIPTATSPHKSGNLILPAEDRLAMCRLAFSSIPCAEVSDYETAKGGVSYSYLTCRAMQEKFPRDKLYFLMGGDMLASFGSWKRPEEILSSVTLAACARRGKRAAAFEADKREIEGRFGVSVASVGYEGAEVSSTRVRTLAALGEDFSAYTLPSVCQYIKENRLYLMEDIARAKTFLREERWQHSVRVAAMCAENAARAGVTERQAIVMGALHDAAKYLSPDSPYLVGCTVPADVPEPVVHQFTGAYLASNYFGINDLAVLDAIRYHTSGRENMLGAEKLLYLCDMLEEGRNFQGIGELRRLFGQDIDACLYAALARQVEYLASTGKPLYALTVRAYEYVKETYARRKNNDKR